MSSKPAIMNKPVVAEFTLYSLLLCLNSTVASGALSAGPECLAIIEKGAVNARNVYA